MLKEYGTITVAIAFIIALIVAHISGIKKGANEVQQKFDAYMQQQQIMVQEQTIKAKQQEVENDQRTYQVAQSYAGDINRLNDALERMRRQAGSAGNVSAPAIRTQSPDGRGAACEGTEFYSKALKAELMLETWQGWAKQQHIPVQ